MVHDLRLGALGQSERLDHLYANQLGDAHEDKSLTQRQVLDSEMDIVFFPSLDFIMATERCFSLCTTPLIGQGQPKKKGPR